MYTEQTLRGPIADALAADLAAFITPEPDPMPCDRWLARSLLHKAIRRGEVELAWRALATLLRDHPAGIWRALTIIAMEDVGVSGMDAFAAVVAAGRDRRWRDRLGGDWKVAAFVVRALCFADHDQATCDLFHHAVGSPVKADLRGSVLDDDLCELADRLREDHREALIDQAITALAVGGGLAEGQRHHDPFAVFEMLADREHCWQVVDACRAAWRISRCALALLLPLVWAGWRARGSFHVAEDHFPPVTYIGQLPDYAIDQFTRTGIQVSRRLLSVDRDVRQMLDDAGIRRSDQHRTVGDLIFLIEGSPLSRRTIWALGDDLRMPHRCLADTVRLGPLLPNALERVAAHRPLIVDLRQQLLST